MRGMCYNNFDLICKEFKMSQNDRPVRKTTAAPRTSASGTVRRTASSAAPVKRTTGASAAPVRRTASSSASTVKRTASSASAPVKRSGKAPVKRTVSTVKRPTAVKRKSNQKKNGFDIETIIAYVMIVVVLGGIITLAAIGIKRTGIFDKKEVEAQLTANIHPIETEAPVEVANNNTPVPGATDDLFAVEAVATPAATAATQTYTGGMRSATIRWIGDFVISKQMIDDAKVLASATGSQYPYEFGPWLSYIKGEMGNADFSVANVDGPTGGKDMRSSGYTGYPQFNTPEYILPAIKDTGVDMLTLANNHMLDTYYDGLMAEIENVEKAGFLHIGANRSQEEKDTPYIHEINGIKVGFLNYTYSVNDIDRLVKGLNPNAMKFGVNACKNSNVTNDARKLREAGADIIVCFMHWGTEYQTDTDANQAYLAKNLVAAGVDVIMGSHPHVVQKAEWLTGTNQFGEMQKTLCMYSVGNYLTDHVKTNTDGGVIFQFTIQEKGDHSFEVTAPCYLPVYVWKTGNEISGRNYYVVNAAKYVSAGTRPNGMSDADYASMKASYNHSVQVMSTGIGNLITQ